MINNISIYASRGNSFHEGERENTLSLKEELIARIRKHTQDETQLFSYCATYEQLLQNPALDISEKTKLFKEITYLLKRFPLDHPDVNRKLVAYLVGFCEFGSDITKEVNVLIQVHAYEICLDPTQRQSIASNLATLLGGTDLMKSIRNYCISAGHTTERVFQERLENLAQMAGRGLGASITILRKTVLEAMNGTIPVGENTPIYYEFFNRLFTNEDHAFFPEHLQQRLTQLRSSFETNFNALFPDGVIRNIDSTQVKELQKEISQEFTLFLQDLTALPCLLFEHNRLPAEIHVAGSLAREEVYPFSDFEGMILFDDRDPNRSAEQKILLRRAVEYISLLVAGIGETMALPLEVQPLIQCSKGFALDALFAKPPVCLNELNQNLQILLATPNQLLSLQKEGSDDEGTRLALYSLLKTKKIVATQQAHLDHENHLQNLLDEKILNDSWKQQIASLQELIKKMIQGNSPRQQITSLQRLLEEMIQCYSQRQDIASLQQLLEEMIQDHSQNQEIALLNLLHNAMVQSHSRRQQIVLQTIQKIHLPQYRSHFGFEGSQGWIEKPLESYHTIDIKEHFIKTLFHPLTSLSIYHGIHKTNILDIIDELAKLEQPVFTMKSAALLKEVVAFIYLLRLKMHLAYIHEPWKGSYDEAQIPLKGKTDRITLENFAYKLIDEEYSLLEKAYWLALRPLYHCLQQIADNNCSIEPIDLSDVAFSILLDDIFDGKIAPSACTPFIKCFVKQLVENQSTDEDHLNLYHKLSISVKYEPLRKVYIKELAQFCDQEALIQRLALVRNRDGFQQARCLEENKLLRDIKAMGQPSQKTQESPSGLQVEILVPSSAIMKLKPEIVEEFFEPLSGALNPYSSERPDEKEYQNCRHTVRSISDYKLHIKDLPDHPCMEYAAYSLMHRLFDHGPPPTQLVRVNIAKEGKKGSYPALISRTVQGKVFDPETDTVNPAHLTELLISHILLLPGDANARNFIFHESALTCIDNDVSFVDPIVAKKVFGMTIDTVQFTSILFCLRNNFFLNQGIIDQFCKIEPFSVINGWLNDLMEREKSYIALFPEVQERKKFLERNREKAFTPFFLIAPGCIARLYEQIIMLQNHFKQQNQNRWTPYDLINNLIGRSDQAKLKTTDIGAKIKKAYEKSRERLTGVERLRQAVGRDIRQSMKSFQAFQAQIGKVPSSEELEKREFFSPEQGLHELYAVDFWGTESGTVIRKGDQTNFKSAFHKMVIDGKPNLERQRLVLNSLLRHFPDTTSETMKELHLSHCKLINDQDVQDLTRSYPGIEILDLSYCPMITSRSIQIIAKELKNLKELYISGCSQITALEVDKGMLRAPTPLIFEKLTILDASSSSITRLQLEANQLKELKITGSTSISKLSLSLPKLEDFYASHIEDFSSIIALTSLKKLALMKCSRMTNDHMNQIMEKNPSLKYLTLKNCPITLESHAPLLRALERLVLIRCSQIIDNNINLLITNTPSLNYLEIRNCPVKELAVHLHLQTLRLAHVPIQMIGGDYSELGVLKVKNCPNLEVIHLISPQLEELNAQQCTALKELRFNSQKLTKLNLRGSTRIALSKELLFQHKTLKFLDLTSNQNLTIDDFQAISANLPLVQELYHKGIPESHAVIVTEDTSLRELRKRLKLSNPTQMHLKWKKSSIKELFNFLREFPNNITKLNLFFSQLDVISTQTLVEVLRDTKVAELDLSNNQIGTEGAKALAKTLPSTQIKKLNLAGNKIGTSGTTALADALPFTLVTDLDLSYNNMTDFQVVVLAEVIPRSQIKSLKLEYNKVGALGAEALALVIAHPLTPIKELNLSDNKIGDAGAQSFSKTLARSRVNKLNLKINEISSKGTKALAEALPQTEITVLNLECNHIGDDEAKALADALPNSFITDLNLANNSIGDGGALALANTLPRSPVNRLNLEWNNIENSGAIKLKIALPRTFVTELNLRGNRIGNVEAKALIEVLPKTQITDCCELGEDHSITYSDYLDALKNK